MLCYLMHPDSSQDLALYKSFTYLIHSAVMGSNLSCDAANVSCSSHASVTKQSNLVPATWQRCPAAGKVAVGLAMSHTSQVYPPTDRMPQYGR